MSSIVEFDGTAQLLRTFSDRFIYRNVEPNECFLSVAPWTHIFGCYSLTRTAVHCRLAVYLPKFEEEKYLQCIEVNNRRVNCVNHNANSFVAV